MKNIPMFATDAGVASLILEEIPYKREAYIRIQSAADPDKLIEEAAAFCKAVGADVVFATGHIFLEQYPIHTQIIRMECDKKLLPAGTPVLHPMTETTLPKWCDIYNTNMKNVSNAASMTLDKARKLLEEHSCNFVYDNGVLLGIGKVSNIGVDAIVSIVPGMGRNVMLALCSVIDTETVSVEVASDNAPAIKLYQRLGFTVAETVSKWFCVSRKNT